MLSDFSFEKLKKNICSFNSIYFISYQLYFVRVCGISKTDIIFKYSLKNYSVKKSQQMRLL